jgi:hypothetical protein
LESEWKPASIHQSSKQQCVICQHRGGAMSEVFHVSGNLWVHEVCRIWTSGSIFHAGNNEHMRIDEDETMSSNHQCCILCNKKDEKRYGRCTTKCAAANCHIHVHPMCALLASLPFYSETHQDDGNNKERVLSVEQAKKIDMDLCRQYTLSFAKVTTSSSGVGRPRLSTSAAVPTTPTPTQQQNLAEQIQTTRSNPTPTTVPVIFCNIHNPNRERSFYALPPGGLKSDLLCVPPVVVDPSG